MNFRLPPRHRISVLVLSVLFFGGGVYRESSRPSEIGRKDLVRCAEWANAILVEPDLNQQVSVLSDPSNGRGFVPKSDDELATLLEEVPEDDEAKQRKFKLEKLEFTISTANEFVVANKNGHLQLDFPNGLSLQLKIADELTPDRAGWNGGGYHEAAEVVLHTEDVHLSKRSTAGGERYHFRTDINLESVDIAARAVTNDGIFPAWLPREKCLALLKTVRSIGLKTQLPKDAAEALRLMGATVWNNDDGKVNFVRIDFRQVSSSSLRLLRGFSDLETLDIHSVSLHPRDFKILSQFPKLKTLRISDSHLGDGGMKQVASLAKLETFQIAGSHQVTGEGVALLKANTNLKNLKIHGCKLSGFDLSALAQCKNLLDVEISFNTMTDRQLEFLLKLKKLRSLKLTINKGLTDACVDTLLKLPATIQEIVIDDNHKSINDARLAELKKKFPAATRQ